MHTILGLMIIDAVFIAWGWFVESDEIFDTTVTGFVLLSIALFINWWWF
ncbi:MAG: hypothetical protein KGI54_17580 [Pseudomonadota bacterium]|nr:hypothetical protein [Pseudomonadota bacterium]